MYVRTYLFTYAKLTSMYEVHNLQQNLLPDCTVHQSCK